VELLNFSPMPCFHMGGAAGACANTGAANANVHAAAMAAYLVFMISSPFGGQAGTA